MTFCRVTKPLCELFDTLILESSPHRFVQDTFLPWCSRQGRYAAEWHPFTWRGMARFLPSAPSLAQNLGYRLRNR